MLKISVLLRLAVNEIVQGERLKRREFIMKPEEYLEDKGEKGGSFSKEEKNEWPENWGSWDSVTSNEETAQKLEAVDSTLRQRVWTKKRPSV